MKLALLSKQELERAQQIVIAYHYLHKRVDVRSSPVGYTIIHNNEEAGLLLFGRPESTRCYPFYGSVEDVRLDRAEVTRWQVLNLSRVWLHPDFQPGGRFHNANYLPGFTDRKGVFRSTLLSHAINLALDSIVIDYLMKRPLCFPDEPYELRHCLSYCDPHFHRGAIYRAAGFELYRTNRRGLQTWQKQLRRLAEDEHAKVLAASRSSQRSQSFRERRAQLALEF